MSGREELQNPEKVSFLYALQTDGYDGPIDDIDYEYMLEKEHRMVQEHVEQVFFQMKDYVYEQHERELLQIKIQARIVAFLKTIITGEMRLR